MVGRRVLALIERMSMSTQVLAAIGALLMVLTVGTVGFHILEREWSWIDAFYFSTYTLTTVGYGDLVPTTDASRLCASVYMLVGVTIAISALGIIGTSYVQRREETVIQKYEERMAKLGAMRRRWSGPDDAPEDEED